MTSRLDARGATLIETLLYIVMATFILGAISTFAIATTDARGSMQVRVEIDQQGTKVVDEITRRVRDAESISTPISGTSNSTLVIITDNPTTNPTTIALDNGAVQITEGSGSPQNLTNSSIVVDSLVFRNTSTSDVDSVSVEIQISYASNSLSRIYQYEQEFYGSATIRK